MSRVAKATLIASIVVSSLTVWGVHFLQQQEHEVLIFPLYNVVKLLLIFAIQTMYQGVLRDNERRRRKLKEREEDFLRSQRKREVYERVQHVESAAPLSESDAKGSCL
jgi:protein PET117